MPAALNPVGAVTPWREDFVKDGWCMAEQEG
jgi:hypothetical protein